MTDPVASPHIFDVDQQDLEAEVLQASLSTPILLDFGASWCEPCKSLGPLLEKLAAEYNGAFRLGKVDVEAQQELAGVFGIRSVPTVMLIKDGQMLDGFAGALPEAELREFLGRHLQPLPPALENVGDIPAPESAEQTVDRLQQEIAAKPEKTQLKLDLAVALMAAGQSDAARAELTALPANLATEARAVRLQSELDLADAMKDAPALAELQQRLQDDPQDWAAHDLLGVQLLQQGSIEAALEQFLTILEKAREWNDGQARKRLLAAFATIDDAALIGPYRRRMASMLF